jgi:hypothetical protein
VFSEPLKNESVKGWARGVLLVCNHEWKRVISRGDGYTRGALDGVSIAIRVRVIAGHPEEELPLVGQNCRERSDFIVVRQVSGERAKFRGNRVSDMLGTDRNLERLGERESPYERFRIAVSFDEARRKPDRLVGRSLWH